MARQQQRDRAGAEPRQGLVGAAGQNDRHAGAEHDAGNLCLGQIFELLRQHVAGFEIGHDKNVRLTGDRRDDAFGLGSLRRDRIVEGERPIEDAAGDLAAIGHLAQSAPRRWWILFSTSRSQPQRGWRLSGSAMPRAWASSMAFWTMSTLSSSVGIDVDGGIGDKQRPRIVRSSRSRRHGSCAARCAAFPRRTIAPMNSSVWRLPFISASTLRSRASATACAAAAWLCSVGTSS